MSRSAAAATPIVELENVTVWRGQTRVLRDLSLELHRGRNTAILGPNGAGKSTLLKLLSLEIHPEHRPVSRFRLLGRDRWDVWDLRSRLGIVSHDLQAVYADHATGLEVVLSGFTATPRVWPHQRFDAQQRTQALETLDRLGLDALRDKRFGTMSTGEQRRFLLARALVHDPEVLVLDEPTSGLDPKAGFLYLDLVRGLMQEGRTVVLVTHQIHEIPPEIERVVLLDAGRVAADGRTEDVLTDARLSDLFGTPMRVVTGNGYYQVVPGAPSRAG